jgi:hypothetical protein
MQEIKQFAAVCTDTQKSPGENVSLQKGLLCRDFFVCEHMYSKLQWDGCICRETWVGTVNSYKGCSCKAATQQVSTGTCPVPF